MGVSLRRRQARVTEKFLDCTQIGAGLEQVRREAVPQGVRARFLLKSQLFSVVF
jgi:hypothetical protein